MQLSESLQDYLEAILIILQDKPVCRITDIQKIIDVSKPSIVNAVSILKNKGLINQQKYGYITLTDNGKKEADIIYCKHIAIRGFLINLFNFDYKSANTLACEMEHHFCKKTVQIMKTMTENIKKHPNLKKRLLEE